jgi:flagellar hook protein FlgE
MADDMSIFGASNVAAVSGLRARGAALQVGANNVANVNNPDHTPQRANFRSAEPGVKVSISDAGRALSKGGQGVDLAREMVDQNVNKNGFKANLAAIRTQDEMTETVLDLLS